LGVLAAVGLFAMSPHLPASEWVRLGAALVGLVVIAAHALRGDEVERRLAIDAGAAAFALSLGGAFAAALFATPSQDLVVRYGWAVMMALWLAAWALLRLRQG